MSETPDHDEDAAAEQAKARIRARKTLEALQSQAVGKQHATWEMQKAMIQAANECGESLADIAEWLVKTLSQREARIHPDLREAACNRKREAAHARTRELVSS